MYKISQRLLELEPYEPIMGEYNIRLDANESPYNLTKEMMSSLSYELTKLDFNRYPDPYATKCVAAFAEYYGLKAENVVAGNGSDELIGLIMSVLVAQDDIVCILSEDFSMYKLYAYLYNRKVLKFQKNDDLTVDVTKLSEMCLENNVKMLIFSNPCNPTSLGIEKTEIEWLVQSLPDTLIILDEAYMDFWDNKQSLLDKIEDFHNLIILRTCSKAIGLAGIRMGFAVANSDIIKIFNAVKAPYNTNIVSQKLAEIVLSHKEVLQKNIAEIVANTAELCRKLPLEFKVFDTKTNFVFMETKKAEYLQTGFAKNGIALRRMGDYLRITTGTKSQNDTLLQTLQKLL